MRSCINQTDVQRCVPYFSVLHFRVNFRSRKKLITWSMQQRFSLLPSLICLFFVTLKAEQTIFSLSRDTIFRDSPEPHVKKKRFSLILFDFMSLSSIHKNQFFTEILFSFTAHTNIQFSLSCLPTIWWKKPSIFSCHAMWLATSLKRRKKMWKKKTPSHAIWPAMRPFCW